MTRAAGHRSPIPAPGRAESDPDRRGVTRGPPSTKAPGGRSAGGVESEMSDPVSRSMGVFSSRRALVMGFLALATLLGGTLGWGTTASIAGAVIASGRVEVESRDQVVEHIDGGTVSEILVRNGDRVVAGQALVRLDGEELESEEAMLVAELAELVARRNRLEAEFHGADTIRWDRSLERRAESEDSVRTVLDGQRRLFEARLASSAGQAAQLRERVVQTRKQVASLEAQARAVERRKELTARELGAQRQLFEEGLSELRPLMALEHEAARLDGEAGQIAARIAAVTSRISEIEIQILQIDTQRIEEAEAEARDAQARETQLRERLAAVRSRLRRMEVRAPVAGEVFDMQVFAPLEVVRPGEPILRVVPEGMALVVRVQLDPIHVDQVWRGQDAVVLFTAFSSRTTPAFEGRVLHVAADATHDERTGMSWYEVEVVPGAAVEPELEIATAAAWEAAIEWIGAGPVRWIAEHRAVPEWLRSTLSAGADGEAGDGLAEQAVAIGPEPAPTAMPVLARDLALAPGMPAEVHIRTGDRSPLSYFAKPLTDFFSRSLREE